MSAADEPHDIEETPWLSFSDAVTALLFVFIITTFWFMLQLEEARRRLEEQTLLQKTELSRLQGAERAGNLLLADLSACLTDPAKRGPRIHPVVDTQSRTMSLYIEPSAINVVEWFTACSAEITPEAGQVVSAVRSCLAAEIPTLVKDYTVQLTVEGHTDARRPGASCSSRFPSNWELSGARSGAALRFLTCDDGGCDQKQRVEAGVLGEHAQDSHELQLVAAGRSASRPALRALCSPDWPGASVDPALDAEVCAALFADPKRPDTTLAATAIFRSLGGRGTGDDALIRWANDPRCRAGSRECEERFRRLRRVDLRVDLRPRTDTR